MHRFRKKSDPKRVHLPEDILPRPLHPHHHQQQHQQHHPLPPLPPVNDFRTSLILPDLTRRFSVLRNSSGEPIGLDDLKSKFAEQRARGSQHQLTEEEEDMILEALGRFHAKSTTGTPAQPTNTTDQDPPASIMDLSAPVQSDDPEAPPSSTPASPSYTGRQSVRSATSVGRASSAVSITSSSSSAPFSSTKGSQASRRMSNNLFGSGKFRDYSYIRTVNHQRRTDSTRSDTPTHSDATTTGMDTITINKSEQSASIYSDAHSPRPVTPEGSGHSTSISSSPSRDKAADSASETSDTTTFSSRLTKALSPDHLRRASRALDEVIRELEEEGDDEIVMERFPITRVLSTKPIVRYPEPSLVFHLPPSLIVNTTPHQLQPEPERTMSPLPPTAPASASTAEFEAGQAFSSDEPVVVDETHPESPSGSRPHSRQASPVPRLPGYIPGMPRPMTPHDSTSSQSTVDTDDQTPSATPRATSPRLPSITSQSPMFSQSLVSSLLRSNSSASTTNRNGQRSRSPASAPGTSSPLFFHRSTNGRFTPDERTRNTSGTPDSDPESPTLNRRRPTSPLSGQAYQPLNSSTSTSHPNISRPSTPSNIVWNPPSSTRTGRSGSFTGYFSNSGHSRNNSSTSIGVTSTEALAGHAESFLDRSKSLTRSLRSPALPDSPFVDNGHTGAGISSMMGQGYGRPPSAMSGIDLGSPVGNPSRPLRSPTPTHAHNGSASPIGQMFPSFMNGSSNGLFNHNNHTSSSSPSPPSPRASSRQNQHGSFSLSPAHALLLQPLANSSRSSLESAGSSYHSWDEENKNDRLFGFFGKLDPQQPEWHDITISVHDKSGSTTSTTATTTTTSGTTESSPSIGGSGGSTVESEEVVRRVIGLTKNDFVSIQDKLVAAALTKAATPEGRNRAASLRRRRPSTSQSNYSTGGGDNRVASPAPQPTNTSPRVATSDQLAKASALLDSVVDSIQSPRAQPQVLPSLTHPEPSSSSSPIPATLEIPPAQPSPTARHRALADALFGVQDRPKTPEGPLPSFLSSSSSPLLQEEIGMVVAAPVPMQSVHAQVHVVTGTSDDDGDGDVGIAREETPMGRDQDTPKPNMLSFSMKRDVTTPSAAPVVVLNQQTQPSTPPATQTSGFISHSPSPRQMDPALLAEEVQRRAEAATAALRKSPSHPKINEVGSTRKRISPNQISSPKLMSASTSVDTIPLRPTVPTNTTTTNTTTTPATTPQKETGKLGFRLKRLRGTLRAKPHVPSAEEITPFPLDLKSGSGRSTTQSPSFSPYNSVSSSAGISMSSATDSTRSRMPGGASVGLGLGGGERGGGAQSPPTTSGPGIKGFMSRFRKHRAASDASTPPPSRSGPLGSSGLSSAGGSISSNANGAMGMEKAFVSLQPQIHSAPPMKSQFSMTTTTQARNGGAVASGGAQRPGTPQTFTPEPTIPENDVPQLLDGIVPSHTQEDEALKQLFDAATNLGLDQSAIGALLARSPSTARSTAWSRLARENSVTGNRKSVRSTARASTISQYTTQSEGRPSVDSIPPPVPRASLEVKQLNIRKNTEPLTPRARPNRNEDAANPVVRRTIVFASDSRTSGFDLGAIIRKQSTSRKRRSAGAGSLKSNRSIQDRAPTPPPPRASGGGGRRFSIDTAGSPPVPQIPGNGMLVVPSSSTMDQINPGQMEKSSSAYDSLYDMYAGETRAGSSANPDVQQQGNGVGAAYNEPMPENAQAVEVVELANGEIIWSIVNGLRDDDAESAYGDRASFTSEYSQNEAVKVFFKEHGRKSSKSSATSFLSRKKNPRPETKILYSSSAKIGRLIENLSQGVDSGSFNITPDRSTSPVGHSASSSIGSSVDMHMSVEERLTAMLNSMASP